MPVESHETYLLDDPPEFDARRFDFGGDATVKTVRCRKCKCSRKRRTAGALPWGWVVTVCSNGNSDALCPRCSVSEDSIERARRLVR